MANPSKQKGTGFENKVLDWLRPIWPSVDRAKSGNESCDFYGTGDWIIEAKKRKRWDIPAWVRKIRKRAAVEVRVTYPDPRTVKSEYPWVIFIEPGDLRKEHDLGAIAVMDAMVARDLLALARWEDALALGGG